MSECVCVCVCVCGVCVCVCVCVVLCDHQHRNLATAHAEIKYHHLFFVVRVQCPWLRIKAHSHVTDRSVETGQSGKR